jgi:hypothetical protein
VIVEKALCSESLSGLFQAGNVALWLSAFIGFLFMDRSSWVILLPRPVSFFSSVFEPCFLGPWLREIHRYTTQTYTKFRQPSAPSPDYRFTLDRNAEESRGENGAEDEEEASLLSYGEERDEGDEVEVNGYEGDEEENKRKTQKKETIKQPARESGYEMSNRRLEERRAQPS